MILRKCLHACMHGHAYGVTRERQMETAFRLYHGKHARRRSGQRQPGGKTESRITPTQLLPLETNQGPDRTNTWARTWTHGQKGRRAAARLQEKWELGGGRGSWLVRAKLTYKVVRLETALVGGSAARQASSPCPSGWFWPACSLHSLTRIFRPSSLGL